ncbi:hypothetical protein ACSBR2_031785 [Camellia fascicularis]
MADTEAKQPTETVQDDEKRLKYLDFVQVVAIYVIENSGSLKSGVQTVDGTVKTVIGPVYEKFHDIPFELLKLIDRKTLSAAHKAPEVVRAVASKVQRTGVVDTTVNITKAVYTKYNPTAKELYVKYEPVGEQYAVSAWQSMNWLPLFPQVAGIVVSLAAYWTDKYNQAVCYTAKKGFMVTVYMPLVPIDRIAKVFEEAEHGPTASTNGEVVPMTQ